MFDFLLNARDRLDDGRHANTVFDEAGNPFAIDHELILEPGYEAIKASSLSDEHIDLFVANPETRATLLSEDWGDFFERYMPKDHLFDSKEEIDRRKSSKAEFLSRISLVRARVGT
ncbi:hypothetical protein [Pseudomonas sp. NFACC02]|uniref:hypothetical protein n=1 Tax=Pseudomonas sp. NFACC02 TaxID=1566250 RepID=UPI000B873516|nr:hypothetical protein [Pseudomonas sp. NFACC02]